VRKETSALTFSHHVLERTSKGGGMDRIGRLGAVGKRKKGK